MRRIGNGRFELKKNAAGRDSWMLRGGVVDESDAAALRGATAELTGRQALTEEERQRGRQARKFARKQKGRVSDLIHDITGAEPSSFTVDASTYEQGAYHRARFTVSTSSVEGSAQIRTPNGDIVFSYKASRENAARGLVSTGNEDEVAVFYEGTRIETLDDLSAVLPEHLRTGLGDMNLIPGSVGREVKAERERVRSGKKLVRRSRNDAQEQATNMFGQQSSGMNLAADTYSRRYTHNGLYTTEHERVEGEMNVKTSQGDTRVQVVFSQATTTRGLVKLEIKKQLQVLHGGKEVKTIDDLEASVAR